MQICVNALVLYAPVLQTRDMERSHREEGFMGKRRKVKCHEL